MHDKTVPLRSSVYREMAGVPLALGVQFSSRRSAFHFTVEDLVTLAKASRRPVVGRVVDRPEWAVGHSDPIPGQDAGCQASGVEPFAYDEAVKRVGSAFPGIDYMGEVRSGASFVRVLNRVSVFRLLPWGAVDFRLRQSFIAIACCRGSGGGSYVASCCCFVYSSRMSFT